MPTRYAESRMTVNAWKLTDVVTSDGHCSGPPGRFSVTTQAGIGARSRYPTHPGATNHYYHSMRGVSRSRIREVPSYVGDGRLVWMMPAAGTWCHRACLCSELAATK